MSDAHRGVIYTQKVVSDASVAREMTALSDRAQAIQKMLGNFELGGLDLSQFQSGVDRAHASLEALHKLALEPATIGAPSMAPAPGVVSQLATYPAATLPPAVTLPPAPAPNPESPAPDVELPAREFKDLKTDLEKMLAAHKAAEDKLLQQTKQSAQAREAANAAAAKVQADQEAELTARAAAENETRAALPERVVRNRIALLTRLQKSEADQQAAETTAAAKQAAQLQKTADAAQKAADKQAAAAQKAADKQAAAAQKAAEAAQKAADKEAAAAQKAGEAEQKAAEKKAAAEQKAAEATQKKLAQQNERAAEEHERAVGRLEHANIRLRRSLSEALVGTTELARGFTELGLVGEEDMDKIKDAILGVQSAVDLIHGGVGVWNALAESAHLYHERLVLIKEAEEAAAAVHAATSATGAASAAGGVATSAAGGLASNGSLAGVIAAAGPLGLALAGLAAAGLGAAYAIHKFKEASEAEAKRDQEKRQEELEIREAQNAGLLQIFAAEKQAGGQTETREAAALKLSQEFGDKRGEYEAEAERRGLKGQAAQQSVADQAAIDQNKLALEHAHKDLAKNEKQADRSRNAEKEVPTGPDRYEEIQRRKQALAREERAALSSGEGDPRSTQAYYARKRQELMGEESQALAARSGVQFAADPKVEAQAKREAEALQEKIEQLEERGAELSREQFRHEMAALNDELQKQQELVAGDKERVKSAAEYAKQQHAALQSALAGYAQLTKAQQQRLVHIQQKLDRGEKVTHSEGAFGAQHLGTKGKRQLEEQQTGSVDQKTRDALFGEEQEKDERGEQQLAQALQKSSQAIKQLAGVMARLAALNERAGGGEKATVELDARGHAELVVKWDQKSSELIAKAIKPELAKWQAAIDEMLDKATEEIKRTLERTIQRKSQKGNAGAG